MVKIFTFIFYQIFNFLFIYKCFILDFYFNSATKPITQNLVLHKFPQWGPTFEISFEFKIEQHLDSRIHGNYVTVLTLTERRGQCCKVGDRIPSVLLYVVSRKFHIATQIGSEWNNWRNSAQSYVTHRWYNIKLKQFLENGKYVIKIVVFIFYLNFVLVFSIQH